MSGAQAALDRAHELCLEYKVFDMALGLAGGTARGAFAVPCISRACMVHCYKYGLEPRFSFGSEPSFSRAGAKQKSAVL